MMSSYKDGKHRKKRDGTTRRHKRRGRGGGKKTKGEKLKSEK
jgi:hypothetical protein